MASVERVLEIANPGPNEVEMPLVKKGDDKLEQENWPKNGQIKA